MERASLALVSQTSFGHISTNSLTILTVSMATENPWKDLLINTSHTSKQSVLAEILGRSTSNLSQTSFSHISTNSSTILTVSTATESPWKDLSIGTSHASKQSVLAKILGRSTDNHYGTVY